MPIRDINNNIINRIGFETLDFQRRVLANGGNILASNELQAADFYCKQMRLNDLFNLLHAVYLFVGGNGGVGSVNSQVVNLINNATFNLTPTNVTDAMCTASGFTGNGLNANGGGGAWFTTNFNPSIHFSTRNNVGFGSWSGYVEAFNTTQLLVNTNFGIAFKGFDRAVFADNNTSKFRALNRNSDNTRELTSNNRNYVSINGIDNDPLPNALVDINRAGSYSPNRPTYLFTYKFVYLSQYMTPAQSLVHNRIIDVVQKILNRY